MKKEFIVKMEIANGVKKVIKVCSTLQEAFNTLEKVQNITTKFYVCEEYAI